MESAYKFRFRANHGWDGETVPQDDQVPDEPGLSLAGTVLDSYAVQEVLGVQVLVHRWRRPLRGVRGISLSFPDTVKGRENAHRLDVDPKVSPILETFGYLPELPVLGKWMMRRPPCPECGESMGITTVDSGCFICRCKTEGQPVPFGWVSLLRSGEVRIELWQDGKINEVHRQIVFQPIMELRCSECKELLAELPYSKERGSSIPTPEMGSAPDFYDLWK